MKYQDDRLVSHLLMYYYLDHFEQKIIITTLSPSSTPFLLHEVYAAGCESFL